MCWVPHNLWRQITLFLESWVNSGSPDHRGRVTLQHTEAYQVTRAHVPGHPPKCSYWVGTSQTGAYHRSDRWPPVYTFLVIFLVPWIREYVTNLNPATWIGQCSTREPLKASNGMRE
jgi:hypothetical protein